MFTLSRSRLMMLTSASFALTLHQVTGETAVCETETPAKNTAFVFIKPHANTPAAQRLVADTFKSKGIKILSQGELTGEQIDEVRPGDRIFHLHLLSFHSDSNRISAYPTLTCWSALLTLHSSFF